MTNREFYTAITAITNAEFPDELKAFAEAAIAKMDAANEKRKTAEKKPSKTAIANEPIKIGILERLSDEPMTAAQVGAAFGITTQKASALLRQLVAENKAVSADVTVKGAKGTTTCKGYTLVVVED